MYKKVWCTCEVVVLLIEPTVFWTFLLPSPSLNSSHWSSMWKVLKGFTPVSMCGLSPLQFLAELLACPSVAPWLKIFGKLSIQENLVMTSAYEETYTTCKPASSVTRSCTNWHQPVNYISHPYEDELTAVEIRHPLTNIKCAFCELRWKTGRFEEKFCISSTSLVSAVNRMAARTYREKKTTTTKPSLSLDLRWLDAVFQGQYLPSLSLNYVAINKVLEKLPTQLY